MYALGQRFSLTAEDSGTEGAPVIYRAAERGTAVLSGGIALTDWRPVSDTDTLRLLDPAVRRRVVTAAIPPNVSRDALGFSNGGCGFNTVQADYPVALYHGGRRLPLARWPNEGFVYIDEAFAVGGDGSHRVDVKTTNGVFHFAGPRLTHWAGEAELWFNGLWLYPWADERIRCQAIDLKEQRIALTRSPFFGLKKGGAFYAFNAVSEIDRPGEWVLDRARGRICLLPANDLTTNPVRIAVCDTLVSAENTANVMFEGFVFEACRQTAMTFKNCTDMTVAASTVRHTGGWAVRIDGGFRNTVIGCDLDDLGEGGVEAIGGDYETLTPGKHLVENNRIHHIGRVVACYRPGASVRGVGNVIRNNLIYQSDHQALFFDGNDHLIEYNIVHDVCLHTGDAGALYACTRDWAKRGTVIRHNLLHAVGEAVDDNGCHSIYLDDYTSGTILYGNLVSQSTQGINLGGGKDNVVSNNIAFNCRDAIVLNSRGIDSFARASAALGRESGCYRALTRNLTLYSSGLWKSRYPTLLAPLDMDPIDAQNAHGNTICGNAYAGGGGVSVRNARFVMRTCAVTNNLDLCGAPVFADADALDLRLRSDAGVFNVLPGFVPAEFEKMGLYASPLRVSPATKFGTGVTPVITCAERDEANVATLCPVRQEAGPPTLIRWTAKGVPSPWVSRAVLSVDDRWLYVSVSSDVAPNIKLVGHQAWGKADAIELALAVARAPNRHDEPLLLRGYADGRFESVTDGGATEDAAARLAKGTRYEARIDSPASWSAQWRVALETLGFGPDKPLLPLLAQVTVCRSSDGSLTRWARRYARASWDVRGATALWLTPFGDLAFLPGSKPSVSRVAVTWGADKVPMTAGRGAENPTWAPSGSRIEAQFGPVSADLWAAHEFEFTPEKDGTAFIEMKGTQGTPTVWTYYDDFRVEGAELANGDLEDATPGGLPASWQMPSDTNLPDMLIANRRMAASGSRFVMASHDFCPTQPLRVKGGQKVTVRFKARGVLGDGKITHDHYSSLNPPR